MGASSSIQEYGEEVLLAATEGNVVKLMEVLATGDKIVQDTEDATKGIYIWKPKTILSCLFTSLLPAIHTASWGYPTSGGRPRALLSNKFSSQP